MGPPFKVLFERPEKRRINLAIPGALFTTLPPVLLLRIVTSVTHIIIVINRLNLFQFAFFIFVTLVSPLLPNYLRIQNLLMFTAACPHRSCCYEPCGGRKISPRMLHSVDYKLSGTLETRSSFSHFELKVLSKPVLGGITSVEHSITS